MRFTAPVQDLPQHFGRIYGAIVHYLEELNEEHAGPPFAMYYNMDMQNLEIELGFPVKKALPPRDDIRAGEIPGGTFAVCHYTGPYDQCAPAYAHLAEYAQEQGYVPTGLAIEWYLDGPEVPPEKRRTDMAFAVRRVPEHIPA
jgi:effector-binding domain-containing protein